SAFPAACWGGWVVWRGPGGVERNLGASCVSRQIPVASRAMADTASAACRGSTPADGCEKPPRHGSLDDGAGGATGTRPSCGRSPGSGTAARPHSLRADRLSQAARDGAGGRHADPFADPEPDAAQAAPATLADPDTAAVGKPRGDAGDLARRIA